MSKFSRNTILSLLLILGIAVLAACGGQAQETAQEVAPTVAADVEEAVTEEEAPAEEVEAPEMTDEEITLRVFAGNVGQELALTQAAAARYMEMHPNITVEVIDTPAFVEDRLGTYLQLFEAQSPEGDVFQIDVIWPGDLAEHFVDLNEYGGAAIAAEHFDAIVENNTVDGALIGMPWFTDAGLLYYRTDLLEKYGYDAPPATWDELEEMAATIQEGEQAENPDFWGYVWQGNAYEGLTCDALEWIASNNGGSIVSPDGIITINNPNAMAIVDQAAGWVNTISPPGVTGFGEEDARGIWQAGNAAFMRNWPYAYSLGNADDSVIAGMFDVAPLPAGEGSPAATLGGWQLAVSRYSEHPAEAADLAFFLTSYDEQKIRAIEGSFNPTIEALYDDQEVLAAAPFFGSLYDVFINAVARPSTATAPNYSATSELFFRAVHSVLTGDSDAQTAFEELELDLQDLLGFETGMPEGATVGAIAAGEEAAEDAGDMEPVTIRVFAGNVGQELALTQAAAARYMEMHPNVTVEVIDTPAFVEDRLGTYLQLFEAQSPEGDVFQIDVIWPGDLAEHFVDLNEYGGAAIAAEHFDAIVENNTVDGALIGMPWFTDAGLLYYRTDLLEKYGYDAPPATWTELEDMAAVIQEGERAENPDFWGFVWQGNAYEGLTCDALEWVSSNNGGSIISPDGIITINNPNAVAIVDQAAGWVDTISPPGVTGFGEEDARGIWQAGNAAFMRNWPYAYSLGNADDSVIAGLFDVSPLPAGEGSPAATLGGWQLAVSRYSENPEVAADVAFYLTSYEEQKIRAIEGSFNPTIEALYEDPDVLAATPFFGSLYDVFINAVARPSTVTAPNYSPTSELFFRAVHSVLTGDSDAQTAFEELELDLQDLHGFDVGAP